MKRLYPSLFLCLRPAVLTGILGGAYIALVDVAVFCWRSSLGPLSLLAVSLLKIVLFYAGLGGLGMVLVGASVYGYLRLKKVAVSPSTPIAFDTAVVVFITVFLVMSQIVRVISFPSIHTILGVVFLSTSAAWTARAFMHLLCHRRRWLERALWISAVFLAALWLAIIVHDSVSARMPLRATASSVSAAGPDRPNILWIVLDSVRADHLSCYGYRRRTTPSIDRIAREGVRYLQAIASAPSCFDSQASMLTGQSPGALGQRETEWPWLDRKFTTIAHLLADKGYETAAISENERFVSPATNLDQGFKYFVVTGPVHYWQALLVPSTLREMQATSWGKALGIRYLARLFDRTIPTPVKENPTMQTNRIATRLVGQWVHQRSPFFLYINYMTAHSPYGRSPASGRYLKEISMTPLEAAWRVSESNASPAGLWTRQKVLKERDRQALNALYDGDLSYLDEKVGELFAVLRQQRILNKTLVIITSDHGERLGKHNLVGNQVSLSHRLLHVPMIIRYPSPAFPPGTKTGQLVQPADLFPMISKLTERSDDRAQRALGRRSLQGLQPRTSVLSELFLPAVVNNPVAYLANRKHQDSEDSILIGEARSVYAEGYHLIVSRKGERLFDVSRDPDELQDLWQTRQDVVRRLRGILRGQESLSDPYWGPKFNVADE